MEVPDAQAPEAAGPVSDRVRLARVALEAAVGVDGVMGPYDPPLGRYTTLGSGQRIAGVTVAAGAGGLYEVGLHLVVEAVPLPALAEQVRRRVATATARAGLAERLGPVSIRIEDLVEPGDPAGPSAAARIHAPAPRRTGPAPRRSDPPANAR